jgi:hypothetical protein
MTLMGKPVPQSGPVLESGSCHFHENSRMHYVQDRSGRNSNGDGAEGRERRGICDDCR